MSATVSENGWRRDPSSIATMNPDRPENGPQEWRQTSGCSRLVSPASSSHYALIMWDEMWRTALLHNWCRRNSSTWNLLRFTFYVHCHTAASRLALLSPCSPPSQSGACLCCAHRIATCVRQLPSYSRRSETYHSLHSFHSNEIKDRTYTRHRLWSFSTTIIKRRILRYARLMSSQIRTSSDCLSSGTFV